MKVDGQPFRSIWVEGDGWTIGAIDQRRLPHEFVIAKMTTCEEAADAIRSMLVRGAPLIGAAAAYGVALAMRGPTGSKIKNVELHNAEPPTEKGFHRRPSV